MALSCRSANLLLLAEALEDLLVVGGENMVVERVVVVTSSQFEEKMEQTVFIIANESR